jgi:hypothetical protein
MENGRRLSRMLSVYIKSDDFELIELVAAREQRSISSLVRAALFDRIHDRHSDLLAANTANDDKKSST